MRVALVPFYKNQLNNSIFQKKEYRDDVSFPYVNLKNKFSEKGIEINTIDITSFKKADAVIFLSLDIHYIIKCFLNNKLKNSIFIQFEPPVVELLNSSKNLKWISKIFGTVLTWQDDLIDNKKFFKFFFPVPPRNKIYKKINFTNKKFITTIISKKKSKRLNQLYSERELAINYFQKKYEDFLFFGFGWDKALHKSYGGKVSTKLEKLRTYKYTICYENEKRINGLISEKIFDCFYSNSIPIFLGAENISDQIPENLFIDKRNFKTYEELDSYLLSIGEKEYDERIDLIEKYLSSESFKKFGCDNFENTIFKLLLNNNKIKLRSGISFFLAKLLIHKLINRVLNYSDAK